MLKLFFASSAMIPVIFMSLNVQAGNEGAAAAPSEIQSYEISMEERLDRIGQCLPGEIPVYFHDTYITQHSAELINTASDITRDCNIESFSVTLYNTDEEPETLTGRETEIDLYLEATNSGVPVETRVEEGKRDSLWLNGRRAVIEFEFNEKPELVASS